MCEEFEFVLANYFAFTSELDREGNVIKQFLSCKDQPYFIQDEDERLKEF